MHTGHLSIRDDTSCHRRCVEGEYSNKVRPHHTWQEARQMIDNFFANSYMHLPGQTIGNIDQDINIVRKKGKGKNTSKGKGKGKKGRGKGYNNNYYNYNYNHYNTYHNQSQQPQKGKSKGKGPIGSFDNNRQREAHQGRQEQQRKGKVYFIYLDIKVLGLWQGWTSSCVLLVQLSEEHQQRSAATTSTSTTTVSASGQCRSAHRIHAS